MKFIKLLIFTFLGFSSQYIFADGYNYRVEVTSDSTLSTIGNKLSTKGRELTIKVDSYYGSDSYLEIKIPEGVYDTNNINYLRLQMYTTQVIASKELTASVYLLDKGYLPNNLTSSTIPNVVAKVGQFTLRKGKQNFVSTDLDKNIIIDYINKNHTYSRNLVLVIKADIADNHEARFASIENLPKFRPFLTINSKKDILTTPQHQKHAIRGIIRREAFLDQTGHSAYFKPDFLMLSNKGKDKYNTRRAFLELDLPTKALTNDVIQDMYLSFYQAYVPNNALLDIYLSTQSTSLPSTLTKNNMPKKDQYIATAYLDPKNNGGFVRARLLHEKIINFIEKQADWDKRFVIRMELRDISNSTVYLGSSFSPISGASPSLSINLKKPNNHISPSVYMQLLVTSDQHKSTPINIKKVFAVDNSNNHANIPMDITEGTNIGSTSPLYYGRNSSIGSPVQTGYIGFTLNEAKYIDKVAIEHQQDPNNHNALTSYAILGSSDGEKWNVLGYANGIRDNSIAGKQTEIIDLGTDISNKPIEGIIHSRTANISNYNYTKRRMMHHLLEYQPLNIISSDKGPKNVSIWIPEMPKGVHARARITRGEFGGGLYFKDLNAGLHVVPLENEWCTIMVAFVSNEPSNFSGDIRFSAHNVDLLPTYSTSDMSSWEGFVHQVENSNSPIVHLMGPKLFFAFSKEEFDMANPNWKTDNYSLRMNFETASKVIPKVVFGIGGFSENAVVPENRTPVGYLYSRGHNKGEGNCGFMDAFSGGTNAGFEVFGKIILNLKNDANGYRLGGYQFWGTSHEFGHQISSNFLLFTNAGEAWANPAAMAMRIGYSPTFKSHDFKLAQDAYNYYYPAFEKSSSISDKNVDRSLFGYVLYQLHIYYGETFFFNMNRHNRDVLNNEYTNQDEIYSASLMWSTDTDQWKLDHIAYISSLAAGEDLRDFFNAWKFNISPEYDAKIAALNLPKGMGKKEATMTLVDLYDTRNLPASEYDMLGLPQ